MAQHLFQSFEISEDGVADEDQNAARVESLFARMSWDLEPSSRLDRMCIDDCRVFEFPVDLN